MRLAFLTADDNRLVWFCQAKMILVDWIVGRMASGVPAKDDDFYEGYHPIACGRECSMQDTIRHRDRYDLKRIVAQVAGSSIECQKTL